MPKPEIPLLFLSEIKLLPRNLEVFTLPNRKIIKGKLIEFQLQKKMLSNYLYN